MPKLTNALLDALHFQIESGSQDQKIGRCLEIPSFEIRSHGEADSNMFEALREEVMRRLNKGAQPIFSGTGKFVFSCWLTDPDNQGTRILDIRDHWCALSDERLMEKAHKEAQDWISTTGGIIQEEKTRIRVTLKSLSARICKAVKTARIQYQADKTAWEKKWEAAKVKHQEDLEKEEQICQMVKVLVNEALRYVELGGRLIVPWATREKKATPAETWHLRTFEEFNRRAKPVQEHRTDKKDADGNITGWSIQYENQNGGETMAGGEQTDLMIQWLGKYAREGDETALRWLHRLSLSASQLFWLAVEQQPDLAEKVSKEWTHVPFATNGTAANAKQAKIKVEMLAMPEPPEFDLKVDPTSRHHELINRISNAVNFLMRTPPVFTPWTGADESAPEWVKTAWKASQSQPQNIDQLHQVYWKIYEAAMTRAPDSPWANHSRPRKEKEKFMKALRARTKGYDEAQTPQ